MKSLTNQKSILCRLVALCCVTVLLCACGSARINITVRDGATDQQDEVTISASSERADAVAQTVAPTVAPTNTPTDVPSNTATNTPTTVPVDTATNTPTTIPTNTATNTPTTAPTNTATATGSAEDANTGSAQSVAATPEPTSESPKERGTLRDRESSIDINASSNSTDTRGSLSVEIDVAVDAATDAAQDAAQDATDAADDATNSVIPQPTIPEPNIPEPNIPEPNIPAPGNGTDTTDTDTTDTDAVTTDNAFEDESADTGNDASREVGGFQFGQTLKGSISLEQISAQYKIDVEANDVLSIRMRMTDGELEPSFVLFAPDGSEVCKDRSSSGVADDVCTITQSGVHNLLIQDNDSNSLNTGSYELHVQRTSNPIDTVGVAIGDNVKGQITDAQMVSSYRLEAGANDVLLVQVGALQEELNPRVEIYAPNGSLLCQESENQVRTTLVCPTATAGPHTLLVMESHYGDGRNFGDYALLIQNLSSPTDSTDDTVLKLGKTVNGAINSENISTLYNINVEASDVLSIRMRTNADEVQPDFTLYAPDGSKVCKDSSYSTLADAVCTIEQSGVYGLLVKDANRDLIGTGSYDLHVQRTSNPVNTTELTMGAYVSGQITDSSMVGNFHFESDAAEVLFVQMGVQNTELNPQIEIYSPDGSLLCDERSTNLRTTLVCPVSAAGRHTVLVMGRPYAEDSNTGDYTLLVQNLNSPTDAQPVQMGATVTGKLETGDSAHFYQVELLAGDALYAKMSVTDATERNDETLDPSIEIYSQNGEQICEESYPGAGTELVCTIEADGAYTMVIRDAIYNSLNGGSYSLYVQDLISPAETSRLDAGKPYTDLLSPEKIAKSYTLTGRSNDVLVLRMTQKDSEVEPNIWLFNPSGVELCEGQTSSAAIELVCTLDEDGEYLVIVSDYTSIAFNDGEFGLFLQNLSDVKNAQSLTTGDSITSVIGDIAEQQTYVIDGSAGSVFAVTLFVVAGDFDPSFRLFDPATGEVVCEFRVYSSSETEQCKLVNDGQHVMMVNSGTASQLRAGEFGLAITKVSAE